MAKIDCSNIFNFISEWERRRKYREKNKQECNEGIPVTLERFLEKKGIDGITLNVVEKLQKWSDEHPRNTRREKFIQMCKDNGFEDLLILCEEQMQCPDIPACLPKDGCEKCKAYWNEVAD